MVSCRQKIIAIEPFEDDDGITTAIEKVHDIDTPTKTSRFAPVSTATTSLATASIHRASRDNTE